MKTYRVTVNYNLNLSERMGNGRYEMQEAMTDWNDFPFREKNSGLVERFLALHDPSTSMDPEKDCGCDIKRVIQQMAELGLQPAGFEEILALGEQHFAETLCEVPVGQQRFLTALGSKVAILNFGDIVIAPALRLSRLYSPDLQLDLATRYVNNGWVPGELYVGVAGTVKGSEVIT